jgi:hypothetical protein
MTNPGLIVSAATTSILFAGFALAQNHETKIQRSELPPKVEQTVREQSQGATIRGFSREKEHGQTLFEAELIVDGRSKDLLINADGTVVEVEKEVATESLPPAVLMSLRKRAGKGEIIQVEALTKADKLTAYEAQILLNGKKSEIQVGPDGKTLPRED